MKQTRLKVLWCIVLAVLSVPLAADRLTLVNGDVITGTIRLVDGETVVIETSYGVLEIARDAVARGEFGIAAGELTDSLVFRFEFDGNFADSAGAHTPTNNGLRFVADRNGTPASAARSDGAGTYLSIPPSAQLNELGQLTLTFWVQVEDVSSRQYLFSKWNRAEGDTADGKIAVQTAGGNLTAYFVAPSGTYSWITARSAIEPLTWHHVAVSVSAGRAALYVDGQLAASERFDFTGLFEDSSPVLVLTALSQTEDPFTYYNAVGSVDDLRLYSRALSPDEISFLASSGTE